jgi:hypothetical protein
MKHGMVRLDNVWGVGGGIKPVKYLVSDSLNVFLPGLWIRIRIGNPDPGARKLRNFSGKNAVFSYLKKCYH